MSANFDETDNKNMPKKAAALKYDKAKSTAPALVAKGRGALAERIIAVAQEHNIPIQSDADLVEILETLDIEDEIPLEVYSVVAEIFAYIYKINQKKAAL